MARIKTGMVNDSFLVKMYRFFQGAAKPAAAKRPIWSEHYDRKTGRIISRHRSLSHKGTVQKDYKLNGTGIGETARRLSKITSGMYGKISES
jgi:hypothetical protein